MVHPALAGKEGYTEFSQIAAGKLSVAVCQKCASVQAVACIFFTYDQQLAIAVSLVAHQITH